MSTSVEVDATPFSADIAPRDPQPSLPKSDSVPDQTSQVSELPTSSSALHTQAMTTERTKSALRVVSRLIVTAVCTIVAILIPGFGKVMAFLGSFSAFLICIILPVRHSLIGFISFPPGMSTNQHQRDEKKEELTSDMNI